MIVQVAGFHNETELRAVLSHAIDWVGIPLRLAYHLPDVTDAQAQMLCDLASQLGAKPVLITYLDKFEPLVSLAQYLHVNHVQLHGDVSPALCRQLRETFPEWTLIKSVVFERGHEPSSLLNSKKYEPFVDWFITDTFDPLTGARGATGVAHDWRFSADLVQASSIPVMVAGGLNPTNVRRCVSETGCSGVDAHTGLEDRQGIKSPGLVAEFVRAAKGKKASR